MMSVMSVQNQVPVSSENITSTLEKGGRNPCVVELDDILEDLLKYFNELEILCKTEKEIEYICEIVKEQDDCWSEDDIKQAWGKRKRIDGDKRRARWAVVIVMQILKRQRTKDEESDLRGLKHLFDTPDQMKAERENGGGEDVIWSTVDINQACGEAESLKVISEERSTQSSDELKTLGAAGGDEQMSGGNHPTFSYLWQTQYLSHFWTGRPDQCQVRSQDTVNSAPDAQFRTLGSEKHMYSGDETFYIRIPRLKRFHNEPTADLDDLVPHVRSRYKLINGFPSDSTVNITRSYAMSFDNDTGNAELVYEILNRETLKDNCKKLNSFGKVYHKGHLAAAANHRWCREAYNDANLFSNIIPQHHLLNIRTWKNLENMCRNMTTLNGIRNVHVYTGPLYIRPEYQFGFDSTFTFRFGSLADTSIQSRLKIVPTHLFKVIIVENENGTVEEPECYVIPNKEPQHINLNVYKMDIETFQRDSGLKFIERRPNVGDTDRIKTVRLQGEDLNQTPRYANIEVRITHNVNR